MGFRTYQAVMLLTPTAQFWRGIQVFPLESVCVSEVLAWPKSAAIMISMVAPVVLIAGDVAVPDPEAAAEVWAIGEITVPRGLMVSESVTLAVALLESVTVI